MKKHVRKAQSGDLRKRIGSNPTNRAEKAPGRKSTGQGGQNQNGCASIEFKGGLNGKESTVKPSKISLAAQAAKEAKAKLISELEKAIRSAPTLGQLLKGTPCVIIRAGKGTIFKVYRYREALAEVHGRAKRLKINNGDEVSFREVSEPGKAERKKLVREARRLARNK